MGSIPGSGRSPGEGISKPLQYSCQKTPHGQRSLLGYSPWGREVSNDLAAKHSTAQKPDGQYAVGSESKQWRKYTQAWFPFSHLYTPLLVWGQAEATSQDTFSSTLVAVPQTSANQEPWRYSNQIPKMIWRMPVSLDYFVCVYLPCKGDATSTLWPHRAGGEDLEESSLISVTLNLPVLSLLPCDAPDFFRSEKLKQLSLPYAGKKWEMTSSILLLVFHIDKWSSCSWTRNLQVHS